MSLTKILCLLLIIVSCSVLVDNRSYNNGLIFYNLDNQSVYLPPTVSVSRGRGLSKFKYSSRGSIWSTFGKPCDCSGPLCGCCVGIKVKQFNFDQKMCANVSYISPKEEIQLEVFLNDTSTAKYGVAARNPQPLCVPIMMGIPMSMCIQMSNIGIQGDNLNMCMDFLVRLASTELFEMHFQCMKMGLQGIGWVGPDGQPVIPANEGKIKDRSSDESYEYYDEEEVEKGNVNANEVVSKEKQKENEITKLEFEFDGSEEEGNNKAEEEMDENDITEKIMDIVKETEREESMKESENEIEKLGEEDKNKDQVDLKVEESKIEGQANKVENTDDLENANEKEKQTIQNENVNENERETLQNDKFVIITEDDKPDFVEEPTASHEFENNSEELDNGYINNIQENIAEELSNMISNDNMLETMATTEEMEKESIPITQRIDELPITLAIEKETLIENVSPIIPEKLQSEEEPSAEIEKFEMLTNDVEGTSELNKNESDLNNSLEIQHMPLKTTTEQFYMANLKPTKAAVTQTTSETNNIDNIDNSITTATIMTTTTMKTTIATAAATATSEEVNDVATNLIETNNSNNSNNNNNNSNDSDNSQENDSDYDDDKEESDEEDEEKEAEDKDTEEGIETTTVANLNIITSNHNYDNKENTNNEEKDHEELATKETNPTSSNESNSDDSNHNEENDEEENEEDHDDSEEDHDDSDEEGGEEEEDDDENEIETTMTTIADKNDDNKFVEISMSSSTSLNNINTINDSVTSSTSNPLMATTDSTIYNPSSNKSALSDSTASGSNEVNAPNHMSQITSTVAPLPLARKLFTPHRNHRRHRRLRRQLY